MNPKHIILFIAAASCAFVAAAAALHIQKSKDAPKIFQASGIVRGIDWNNSVLRIEHDAIPNFMPAMTMPLSLRDSAPDPSLQIGDPIRFRLTVTGTDCWIDSVVRQFPSTPNSNPQAQVRLAAPDPDRLQPGEKAPDFTLLDQNGKTIRFQQFQGKFVILTFVYTRCPLPTFCPMLSKKFAQLQERLSKNFPGKFALLSVSIDPEFDRPHVLKEYAARYAADERVWTFATGNSDQVDAVCDLFGLVHEKDNGFISHDLRTALLDPNGRLLHIWKSNVWSPYEIERWMREPASLPRTAGL